MTKKAPAVAGAFFMAFSKSGCPTTQKKEYFLVSPEKNKDAACRFVTRTCHQQKARDFGPSEKSSPLYPDRSFLTAVSIVRMTFSNILGQLLASYCYDSEYNNDK
ncbi:hypothetical protein MUN81_19000 [Hymenobacter sp. 5317J-9]|uniref:hypothetical protein n=1 Tax=Hymenobacter sp. 5317J-9 TaxID=2932250 RepID=UPI001FD6D699|nr:hypothetical protein [Hymenobacter sp. 5317J-9]UOQ97314.1 hypothetical protein MUN81_19000 [Hymenobacter sp. 5317J-9]